MVEEYPRTYSPLHESDHCKFEFVRVYGKKPYAIFEYTEMGCGRGESREFMHLDETGNLIKRFAISADKLPERIDNIKKQKGDPAESQKAVEELRRMGINV